MKHERRIKLRVAASLLVLTLSGCGGGANGNGETSGTPASAAVITITTDPNIQCVQTVAFSMTLQQRGATGAVTWTILSGQLPQGLSLDSSTGTISGTPGAGSDVGVTIQAADSQASASETFNFLVYTKLTINPVTPPPAHLNDPYSLTVTATASSAIASWKVVQGQLPPGLALATNGVGNISGVPSQTGTFSFTLQAQDYTIPQTATLDLSIAVDDHLAITKATLKGGEQGQAYSDSFTAVNGTPPYTWTFSGTLPAGLTFDSTSGRFTGTPTNFGGFPYSVSVTDTGASPQSDSGQGNLTIAMQLRIIGALNPAYIGEAYDSPLTAIGGYYPYTWSIASGTLPPGLTFSPGGNIEGTPTQLGSSTFVVQATDSGNPPYSATQSFTVNVTPVPLSILGNPISPAPVNVEYHSQVPVSGGTPPYSWSISSGQLPPGLALGSATGDIDGTPTQVGTFNFVVKGTDSGSPVQTATANDFILIRNGLGRNDSIQTATPLGNSAEQPNPIVLSISPYIDPIGASAANPDTDYYKLVANGGSLVHVETFAQRSWGLDTLDSVLEILDGGGNRIQACTAPGYASACLNDDIDSSTRDSALDLKVPGNPGNQTTFYVHVFDWRGDARPDMQYYLNVSGVVDPLTISPSTLGAGATRGVNYQEQLSSSGGTGSVTWSIASGALPPGWSLSSGGLISGAATTDGFYSFAVLATDSGNPAETAQVQYTVQIAEPVLITSAAAWPNACLNQPYSFTVQTSGGVAPLHYSFTSSQWVASINLDVNTGIISGSAQTVGTFTGTLGVSDSAVPASGQTQTISLTVVNCP